MSSADRSRRPRGRTAPGRRPGASRASGPSRAAARQQAAATVAATQAAKPRSRLTGRAAVLVLVLAVLMVSYASSLRAYLQQRSQINQLKTAIAQHEANIDTLESEKTRWEDPAYVQQQARERLGYVMPGEKTYLVLGEDGKPLEPAAQLEDPTAVIAGTPAAWWSHEWDSVQLAGDPPKASKPPATQIDGTKKGTGGEDSAGETPEEP
jgi:cell division protein FtsL